MGAPTSIIHVCSGVLLNNDYKHTIWFDDHSAQLAYFAGKVAKTFSAYSYIRKSWSLKVDATMEQARTWTYLYFQNGNGKTYYYFINNIEYVNDNTVELFIEMDVMQTYLHEYTLHRCFVEREHSATDEPGDNIVEESLELGELVTLKKSNVDMQELTLLVLSPGYPVGDGLGGRSHWSFDGVYSGLGVYSIDSDHWDEFALDLMENASFNEGIVTMWMYPKSLVQRDGAEESTYKEVKGTGTLDTSTARPTSLDGYTPRNKKLLTYPFNLLYVSNNSGGAGAFRYERFNNPSQCVFRVCGAITPEGGTKMYPTGYDNQPINYDAGVMGGNYPTCAWNQDVYKLWLAQNQHSQNMSMLMNGVQIVAGVAAIAGAPGLGTLAGGGLIASGATAIANNLAQRADMDLQPPQAKGSFSASINIVNEHQTFTLFNKSVDADHARRIDQYFDMFGYRTNEVKIPNRNVRERWTYCKTIDCHVSGGLCTDDLRKIQSIYDNGITFWKNGDSIGNYGQSNNCL